VRCVQGDLGLDQERRDQVEPGPVILGGAVVVLALPVPRRPLFLSQALLS
jgi:hypothetical protein